MRQWNELTKPAPQLTPADALTFTRLQGQIEDGHKRVQAALAQRLESFGAWEDNTLRKAHEWHESRLATCQEEMDSFWVYRNLKYGKQGN